MPDQPPNGRPGSTEAWAVPARPAGEDGGAGPLRILLVDDHRLFAEALALSLHRGAMEVVGVSTTGSGGEELAAALKPDVVLMDLQLPDGDGIDFGARILAKNPGIIMIALTGMPDAAAVKVALRAGFHGFLSKDTPMGSLPSSLRSAVAGHAVISDRIVGAAAGRRSPEVRAALEAAGHLTAREREVLALITRGMTTQEMSADLSVSPHTVRTHVQNILTKLQVRSRLEAAAFATRYGVITARRGD